MTRKSCNVDNKGVRNVNQLVRIARLNRLTSAVNQNRVQKKIDGQMRKRSIRLLYFVILTPAFSGFLQTNGRKMDSEKHQLTTTCTWVTASFSRYSQYSQLLTQYRGTVSMLDKYQIVEDCQ